jgi:hypothetical protein
VPGIVAVPATSRGPYCIPDRNATKAPGVFEACAHRTNPWILQGSGAFPATGQTSPEQTLLVKPAGYLHLLTGSTGGMCVDGWRGSCRRCVCGWSSATKPPIPWVTASAILGERPKPFPGISAAGVTSNGCQQLPQGVRQRQRVARQPRPTSIVGSRPQASCPHLHPCRQGKVADMPHLAAPAPPVVRGHWPPGRRRRENRASDILAAQTGQRRPGVVIDPCAYSPA